METNEVTTSSEVLSEKRITKIVSPPETETGAGNGSAAVVKQTGSSTGNSSNDNDDDDDLAAPPAAKRPRTEESI